MTESETAQRTEHIRTTAQKKKAQEILVSAIPLAMIQKQEDMDRLVDGRAGTQQHNEVQRGTGRRDQRLPGQRACPNNSLVASLRAIVQESQILYELVRLAMILFRLVKRHDWTRLRCDGVLCCVYSARWKNAATICTGRGSFFWFFFAFDVQYSSARVTTCDD